MATDEPVTVGPIVAFCASAGFTVAMCTVGFQLYHLVRFGEWMPISVIWVLQRARVEWALYPGDWIGVHKLLDWLPLSLASVVMGLIPAVIWLTSSDPTKR